MSLVVNTNISSLVAQYQLGQANKQVQSSLERLASGLRLNHASDDATGLAMSQNLTSQIQRMGQAQRNAQDGISMLQVAEGAMSVISESLQRIRELTVQAANDTNGTAARSAIAQEMTSLLRDIDRVASATSFNGLNLLNGTATNALIQIGGNSALATNTLNVTAGLAAAGTGDAGGPGGLGLISGTGTFASIAAITGNTLTTANAHTFLGEIDNAMTALVGQRALVGAYQNQLDSTINSLGSSIENLSTSNSRIRDTDVAQESARLTQYQVMQNAAVSVISQSNKLPQMILSLLDARR